MKNTTRNSIAVLGALLVAAPLAGARAAPGAAFEQTASVAVAQQDAGRLIRQLSANALLVTRHANALESLTRSTPPRVPSAHASELTGTKEAVNAMGASFRELQALRAGALPWQQAVIDQLHPMLAGLAGYTKDAIEQLKENRPFASSEYQRAIGNLSDSARAIRTLTLVHLDYAEAREKLNRLDAAGSDAKTLAGRVRGEMLRLPYYGVFDYLTFQVEDGEVRLGGQVTRPALKDTAERSVRSIEGVESLASTIEVLPVSIEDDRLRRAVYRAIYGHATLARYRLNPHPPIRIVVANGHVALHGTVATELDRNLAHIEANTVPGAFSVTNHLEVGG